MATRTTEPSGLLLVDKPAGITSHDAVSVARRALKTRRVGHAGTLDPFATGLLVILFGRGTRLISYVPGEPKVYEATIRLGAETETDDRTGAITRTADLPSDERIAAAVALLTGNILQTPPAYSAKQVDGTRAYAAARKGMPLDLPAVPVTVHSWSLAAREGGLLQARIVCGSGTYIRALARDLGRLAGSAAHVDELRRTGVGPFSVKDAVTVEDLRRDTFSAQPLPAAVPDLPVRELTADELRRVLHGNSILARNEGGRAALLDAEGNLVSIADLENGELLPKLVLRDA